MRFLRWFTVDLFKDLWKVLVVVLLLLNFFFDEWRNGKRKRKAGQAQQYDSHVQEFAVRECLAKLKRIGEKEVKQEVKK